MKVKVTEKIKDYDWRELPQTYRDVFISALNNTIDTKEVLTTEKKNQIYQLSKKLFTSDEVDLTVTERALILERAEKLKSPLAYGRVKDLLEDSADTPSQESPTE